MPFKLGDLVTYHNVNDDGYGESWEGKLLVIEEVNKSPDKEMGAGYQARFPSKKSLWIVYEKELSGYSPIKEEDIWE